jgi:hypothetical protein
MGPQQIGTITHSLKAFGVPERFACAQCADDAPFTTLVRKLPVPGASEPAPANAAMMHPQRDFAKEARSSP